jgi:hypothetical protein
MLRSWCTRDFALAQVMTTGGSYQRPHTLAAGDKLCRHEMVRNAEAEASQRRG